MKIYGIGTDIANINRIKRSLKNKNFINSNLKIKFEKTSNDTYLKLFDFLI